MPNFLELFRSKCILFRNKLARLTLPYNSLKPKGELGALVTMQSLCQILDLDGKVCQKVKNIPKKFYNIEPHFLVT
jgi:hypothetical protein